MCFDVCHTLSIGLPPKPVHSVSEVEEPDGMAGIFWSEERLSVCEKSLTVSRWCCSTHAGSRLYHCDGGVVEGRGRMSWCAVDEVTLLERFELRKCHPLQSNTLFSVT